MTIFTKCKATLKDQPQNDPTVMTGAEHDSHQAKYDAFDRGLARFKARKISKMKSKLNKKLLATDWYIVRKNELGTAIPESITTARAALRQSMLESEIAINAETDKEVLRLIQ